jgi:hypothetical protein
MSLASSLKNVWDIVSGNKMVDSRPGLEDYRHNFTGFLASNIVIGAVVGGFLDPITVPQAIGIFMVADLALNPAKTLQRTQVYDKLQKKGRLMDIPPSPEAP